MNQIDLISPGALQPFVICLEKRGIDASRFLERHRIPPASVDSGFGKIAKYQMYRFFEDVAYREVVGTLGFLDGDPYQISELGMVGAAVQRSVSLQDAIDTFSLLLPTVAEGNTIGLIWGTKMSWLCCRTDSLARTDRIPDHTTVLVLREVVRLAAGDDWQPDDICFYTDFDPAISMFRVLAGVHLRFLQDATAISFPTDLLHRPLIGGSRRWTRCDGTVNLDSTTVTVGDRLCRILQTLQQFDRLPLADETAEMLGMSRVTLFRTLAAEGTSYRQAIDRVRFTAAVRLLEDPTLSIKEISYELGYSSPGNFTRAFRRMSGLTPTLFRLKQATS
jgi:AraC-like DNA-binding protein